MKFICSATPNRQESETAFSFLAQPSTTLAEIFLQTNALFSVHILPLATYSAKALKTMFAFSLIARLLCTNLDANDKKEVTVIKTCIIMVDVKMENSIANLNSSILLFPNYWIASFPTLVFSL